MKIFARNVFIFYPISFLSPPLPLYSLHKKTLGSREISLTIFIEIGLDLA